MAPHRFPLSFVLLCSEHCFVPSEIVQSVSAGILSHRFVFILPWPPHFRRCELGYRSGYKALRRVITGVLRGLRRYKSGHEVPKLIRTEAPDNPTQNPTQGCRSRPTTHLFQGDFEFCSLPPLLPGGPRGRSVVPFSLGHGGFGADSGAAPGGNIFFRSIVALSAARS